MCTDYKDLAQLLHESEDSIYQLLEETLVELDTIFYYGASNAPSFLDILQMVGWHQIDALNFPSKLTLFQREQLIARHRTTYCLDDNKTFDYMGVFSRGMGVCSHYAFYSLLILSQKYQFSARIENIYSDQVHTYAVLTDSNGVEYVFDAWSRAVLRYDNDIEWNEVMNYIYRRNSESKIQVIAEYDSDELRDYAAELTKPDIIEERNVNFTCIQRLARMSFEKGPALFCLVNEEEKDRATASPLSVVRCFSPSPSYSI